MFRRLALPAVTLIAVLTVAAAPAAAATALPAPGTPVAGTVTTTTLTISWSPSSGAVRSYTVQQLVDWLFLDVATTTGTAYTASGLKPDTVYEYRVIANPVAGSGATVSDPSGVGFVTTRPLPDSIPPTKPASPPLMTGVGLTAATVNSGQSTDNNRVATYVAQLLVGGVWTDVADNNINVVYLRNLSPATSYTVATVGVDPNGNRSPRSDPTTFTTRSVAPAPTCNAQIIAFNLGYTIYLTVENMTLTPVTNWKITFTLPVEHTATGAFNGTLTRSGAVGTLTPAVYLATLGSGGGATLGISGGYPAGSVLPSGFVLSSPTLTSVCTTTRL
jgi:chitodextrinase